MATIYRDDFTSGAMANPRQGTHGGYLTFGTDVAPIVSLENNALKFTFTGNQNDICYISDDAKAVTLTSIAAGYFALVEMLFSPSFPEWLIGLKDNDQGNVNTNEIVSQFYVRDDADNNAGRINTRGLAGADTDALTDVVARIPFPPSGSSSNTKVDFCLVVRRQVGSEWEIEFWVKEEHVFGAFPGSGNWVCGRKLLLTPSDTDIYFDFRALTPAAGDICWMKHIWVGTAFDFDPATQSRWNQASASSQGGHIPGSIQYFDSGTTVVHALDANEGAGFTDGHTVLRTSTDGNFSLWGDATVANPFPITADVRYVGAGLIGDPATDELVVFSSKRTDAPSAGNEIVARYSDDAGASFGSEMTLYTQSPAGQTLTAEKPGFLTSTGTWIIPSSGAGSNGIVSWTTTPSVEASWNTVNPISAGDSNKQEVTVIEIEDIGKLFMAWRTLTYINAAWCHSLDDLSADNWGTLDNPDDEWVIYDGLSSSRSRPLIQNSTDPFDILYFQGKLFFFLMGHKFHLPRRNTIAVWISEDYGLTWELYDTSPIYHSHASCQSPHFIVYDNGLLGIITTRAFVYTYYDPNFFKPFLNLPSYSTTTTVTRNRTRLVTGLNQTFDGRYVVNQVPVPVDTKVTDVIETSRGATIYADRRQRRSSRGVIFDNR